MKDNTHDIGQDAIGANRTRTFVFITRLCATLVSHELLPLLVLGAPSTSGPGLQTDFRFTYNTSDIYVDRVCRRAPVLLDPSAEPPCRIVDRNCVVDNPCVKPDPVDKLLAIAPCPPVWNPALVCSSDIGTKLECSEKFEILLKCFLSSNRTLYDLTTATKRQKLKHACGHWFKACHDELHRLSEVFPNFVAPQDPVTEILPTHTDRDTTGEGSTDTSRTTHATNSDNAFQTTYHLIPTTHVNVNPTVGMVEVRTPDEVPDSEPLVVVLWLLGGILISPCSMIILFVICKRKHSRRQKMKVTVKRTSGFDETSYHGSFNVMVEIAVEDKDVSMETTPFLADDVPQESHPRSVDTQKTTPCSVDSREAATHSEPLTTISQDKPGSETKSSSAKEKMTSEPPTGKVVDQKKNQLKPINTNHKETNIETETPVPESVDDPHINSPCPVTNQDTAKNETIPQPKPPDISKSKIESGRDLEVNIETIQSEESPAAGSDDEERDNSIPFIDDDSKTN